MDRGEKGGLDFNRLARALIFSYKDDSVLKESPLLQEMKIAPA
jgi:hypothetical protein